MGLSSPEIVFRRNFRNRGKAPAESHGRMIGNEIIYGIFDL
jgi:hypothetical protein